MIILKNKIIRHALYTHYTPSSSNITISSKSFPILCDQKPVFMQYQSEKPILKSLSATT